MTEATNQKRRNSCIAAIIVAMLVSALYAWASWSNQFIYDDHEVIENQYPIGSLKDLAQIFREPHYLNFPYYRPITRSTFAIQKTIWGDNPRAFHLFNAGLAGLVMLAAYLLLRRPQFSLRPMAALLAATWLAVHPAASECVYPAASGRETLLPSLVILLAIWAYLHEGAKWVVLSMGLFAAALLCKEQAAVLPGIFVLADLCFVGRAGLARRVWRYIPMVLIFGLYFVVRHFVFEKNNLQLAIWSHPFLPLMSLVYGIQTAVAPFVQLKYEPTQAVWFSTELLAAAVIVTLGLIRSTIVAGPGVRRAGMFWLGWFVLLQLPTAHLLMQQEAPYSERYVFLALLCVSATLAAVGDELLKQARPRIAVMTGVALWIIGLAYVSFFRGYYYTDDASFSAVWMETNPNAVGALNGTARVEQLNHNDAAAIRLYNKVLEFDPESFTARNNLGILLAEHHHYEDAAAQYQFLLRHNQKNATVLCALGRVMIDASMDRRDEEMFLRGQAMIEQAADINPNYAFAHYQLGLCHEQRRNHAAAIAEMETALRLQPGWPEYQKKLADFKATARAAATNPTTRK